MTNLPPGFNRNFRFNSAFAQEHTPVGLSTQSRIVMAEVRIWKRKRARGAGSRFVWCGFVNCHLAGSSFARVALLFHVTPFLVIARGSRMQRDVESLPYRVRIIGEVHMGPMQQMLLFIHCLG